MLWDGKSLREIREHDIRKVLDSGLAEHLQLEYKSATYADNDRGRREFLQDVCMFANTEGGILLIGVSEIRDESGQPTGIPDPTAALGIDLQNPEAVLAAYDARVMEAIEERLPLESVAVDVGQGRTVLAFRILNSARKPHSVRHDGHIFFPGRRDRQRYPMNVREIKELTLRASSRLESAHTKLTNSFLSVQMSINIPYLMMGMIPVFCDDFLVDVRSISVRDKLATFSLYSTDQFKDISFTFGGLERREKEYVARFHRNGLFNTSSPLELKSYPSQPEGTKYFFPTAVDLKARRFFQRAKTIYEAARLDGPFLFSMMLRNQSRLVGIYSDLDHGSTVAAGDYPFPTAQIDSLENIDELIRPYCDQVHQMFGRESSPCFEQNGAWAGVPR